MQAIREIRDVISQELVLKLPEEFLEKTVEIIILPVDNDGVKAAVSDQDEAELEKEIDALSWDMGEKLYTERAQLHER